MTSTRESDAIHPGLMLICGFVLFVCVAASDRWADLMLLGGLVVAGSVVMRVKAASLLQGVLSAWPLLLMAALFHASFRLFFVHEPSSPLLHAGMATLFFLIRLIILIVTSLALLKVHSPAAYAEAAAHSGRFVIGGKLAGNAGNVSMLAMTMLPQLQEFLRQRQLTRKVRRLDSIESWTERLSVLRIELLAVLRYALEYASVLATVLWSRGFRAERFGQLSSRFKSNRRSVIAAVIFCFLCLCTLLPLQIS